MVVGSMQPYIVRMGVEPRWKGLNTAIPVVMVSKRAYSILVAESYSAGLVTFNEDTPVENSSASSNYTITRYSVVWCSVVLCCVVLYYIVSQATLIPLFPPYTTHVQ